MVIYVFTDWIYGDVAVVRRPLVERLSVIILYLKYVILNLIDGWKIEIRNHKYQIPDQ